MSAQARTPGCDTGIDEVDAVLWARREQVAESWDAAPDAGWQAGLDSEWRAEPCAGAVGATAAIERFLAAGLHRDELIFEWERAAEQLARWQAVQVRILAEAQDMTAAGDAVSDTGLPARSMAAELACAVGMSDRTLEQHMNDAAVMRDRFPATFQSLRDGRFSRAHAQVIADEGLRLGDDAVRGEYESLAIDLASQLTTGRLRAAAKAIAETLHPVPIAERHADARADRRIVVRDADDGMAELWALLPAALAHGIHERLTQLARSVREAQSVAEPSGAAVAEESVPMGCDDRTIDQLRADILCDVLLTGHATAAGIDRSGGAGIDAVRGMVQITIPAQVLLGPDRDDRPGTPAMINGRCPIDPETARHLAGAATLWDRVFTDPVTGDVLAVDRRFPTERQRRFLRARDEHCRFPGCRMPTWRSDIDHTVDHHHGGATAVGNLAHLCRRHHTLKHQTAWAVVQDAGGVLTWTSPAGRVYTDRPPPTLRFVPSRT